MLGAAACHSLMLAIPMHLGPGATMDASSKTSSGCVLPAEPYPRTHSEGGSLCCVAGAEMSTRSMPTSLLAGYVHFFRLPRHASPWCTEFLGCMSTHVRAAHILASRSCSSPSPSPGRSIPLLHADAYASITRPIANDLRDCIWSSGPSCFCCFCRPETSSSYSCSKVMISRGRQKHVFKW